MLIELVLLFFSLFKHIFLFQLDVWPDESSCVVNIIFVIPRYCEPDGPPDDDNTKIFN